MFFQFVLLSVLPPAFAVITVDLNCTEYSLAKTGNVYTQTSTACTNIASDQACAIMYPSAAVIVGTNTARPFKCHSFTATGAIDASMKKTALELCPKHCGLCCQTPAFSCRNAQYPSMDCASITQSQCLSPTWRPIIAKECPAACGFCLDGGCVDTIVECANDISICNSIGLQSFVNANCKKTCNRCSTTTITNIASVVGNTGCTTYRRDSSSVCSAWAANGFCTNNFYTPAQRKALCASTCKVC